MAWRFLTLFFIIGGLSVSWAGQCAGRFPNPVTDVCWKCIFPLRLMGAKLVSGGPDEKTHKSAPCLCPRKGVPVPVPGLPISLWEPVRMVDVTRTPWCFVNLGGIQPVKTGIRGRGDVQEKKDATQSSFYNVHWYTWPLITWLELFLDFICLEKGTLDIAYVTELDPTWNDDTKSMILNPEAGLFGAVTAQMACAADCIAATAHLPLDSLSWCGGCQGSLYPYTGSVGAHTGGVQASLLVVSRMIAKLHRELLLMQTVGERALCQPRLAPLIIKSQYRTQMTYPRAQSRACQPLGASSILWQGGREYPTQGEDFGYLIWRKRDCCIF
jgi:conjugal transfer pilus assembly protein TraU